MVRSILARVLPLVLLLGLVGYILAHVLGHGAPQLADGQLPAKGDQALERGDLTEAERVAALLVEKGQAAQAHLLRGKLWVYRARQARRHTGAAPPYEEAQQAAQLLLAGAGAGWQPAAVREAAWLSAGLVQQPVFVPSPERRAIQEALAEFARIEDDGPVGQEAAVLAASRLLELDQQRLVVEGLSAFVKHHPADLEAHRLLAASYMDLNNPTAAIRHLEACGQLEPEDGGPYRWIGFFQKDYGNTREAMAAYREALKRRLKPADRATVVEELAEILIGSQGDYQGALDVLAQVPEAFRDAPAILTLRTDCLWTLRQREEAVRLVERVLRKNPKLPEALLLRARMYLDEDHPRDALPLLKRAVALDHYNNKSRTHLAETYQQLGDAAHAAEQQRLVNETRQSTDELAKLSRQALKQPWDDKVRYQTALLCLKINRLGEAQTWLQAALACNPGNYRARQLLAQVTRRRAARSQSSATTLKP